MKNQVKKLSILLGVVCFMLVCMQLTKPIDSSTIINESATAESGLVVMPVSESWTWAQFGASVAGGAAAGATSGAVAGAFFCCPGGATGGAVTGGVGGAVGGAVGDAVAQAYTYFFGEEAAQKQMTYYSETALD